MLEVISSVFTAMVMGGGLLLGGATSVLLFPAGFVFGLFSGLIS